MKIQKNILILGFLLISSPLSVSAQDKEIGRYGDWVAKYYYENDKKICHIWSVAQNNNDMFGFVTHRPALKRRNEVSFDLGTKLKNDAPVSITIDKDKKFDFFAHNTAVFYKHNSYKKLIAAMKKGNKIALTATKANKKKITASFSLRGITAAIKAIDKSCK